jgi:hypothetical protein
MYLSSLRSRRNVSTEDVRSVLTAEFLSRVVPMMDFLEAFLYKLPIDPKERTYFEVNESTLQKASSNVYPPLEAGYSEFCNNLLPKPNNNYAHTWEKIYLHKVGDLFLCRIFPFNQIKRKKKSYLLSLKICCETICCCINTICYSKLCST